MKLSKEQIYSGLENFIQTHLADDLHQEQMAIQDSIVHEWYLNWLRTAGPEEIEEWEISRVDDYDPPDLEAA